MRVVCSFTSNNETLFVPGFLFIYSLTGREWILVCEHSWSSLTNCSRRTASPPCLTLVALYPPAIRSEWRRPTWAKRWQMRRPKSSVGEIVCGQGCNCSCTRLQRGQIRVFLFFFSRDVAVLFPCEESDWQHPEASGQGGGTLHDDDQRTDVEQGAWGHDHVSANIALSPNLWQTSRTIHIQQ